jgi:hypothetical protein
MRYSVSKTPKKSNLYSKKTKKAYSAPVKNTKKISKRLKKNTSRKVTHMKRKLYNSMMKKRSDMFKGSHIRNLMKIFINHKEGILKDFPKEMLFFIFAGFKPINFKLVSSITTNPRIFFENTKKSTGKYAKNIHPIDLYYTSIICAMAYQNDTLIGLMISMLGDKEVDGNMIRNILDTLLPGYIGPQLRQNGGVNYWKIIQRLIMVANIIYLFIEMSHFYSATENLTYDINNGKIVDMFKLLNGISQDAGVFNECLKIIKTNPPLSNVKKIFGDTFDAFGDYGGFLQKANGIIECADDSTIHLLVNEAFTKASQGFDHPSDKKPIHPINGLVTTMQPPNFKYSTSLNATAANTNNTHPLYTMSQIEMVNMGTTMNAINNVPPQYSLINFVTNENTTLALLNQEQQLHLVKGLATIDEQFRKIAENTSYVEAFHYLENTVDPNDKKDELAQLLLSNEDFMLYKKDKEKKIAMFKEMTKIQIKDTTYLGYISLVLGALKELVWDNPSHTPFLDIIHEIRNKINLYTRFMRDQYNVVNDKVVDSISEFELFQKKINVANIRLTNILLSFITLSIQISYYAIQGLLYLLYNKNRLEALENGKSDSNKKLVTNNADGLNIANTNAYVPNIANNNGPILAIEDESDSNKKLVTNNANEIDELTANFENLNLKNKQ